ncbi:Hypothetical predicted protein [Octopus vulgaris]|uniref:Uncharacterized protein n=1 Tax=Octopus vulgaris TaxID=6645 RepID=A0AA36B460_OCTVU|nr:Hypothetical predicted protein [Octopus vulgaris]
MKGVWKNCVEKRFVGTLYGFNNEHELERIRGNIVKLPKDFSLECEVEDIEDLLDQESEELANEDLIELEKERVEIERRKVEKEEMSEMSFTTKGLSEGLFQLNKLLAHFEAMDPNIERYARIK